MSRRSRGSVYRKKQMQNGKRVVAGFYRARYVDADGEHGQVVSCAAKHHTGRNLGGASHVKNEPDPQK